MFVYKIFKPNIQRYTLQELWWKPPRIFKFQCGFSLSFRDYGGNGAAQIQRVIRRDSTTILLTVLGNCTETTLIQNFSHTET